MACRPLLNNIRKACDKAGNASGLRTTLRLAYVGDVTTVPAPDADTSVISGDIVMETDVDGAATPGTFVEWEFSEIGSNYVFTPEGEEEDGYGTHTLTLFLPKMSAAKNYVLDQARGGKEFIANFDDRNDVSWLMGDDKSGATVVATPGTDQNSRNGYNLTISWKAARLLYQYTGAFSIAADA